MRHLTLPYYTVFLAAVLLVACGEPIDPADVSATDTGLNRPGKLVCVETTGGRKPIGLHVDGQRYAINGAALTLKERGELPSSWRDGREYIQPTKLRQLIDRGLELCY